MPCTTADQVILELLRNAGPAWVGKTKLFTAFYFAHLYYSEERPDFLTDWRIVRLPEGPGIHESEKLLGGLVRDGHVVVDVVREGPYPEYRYRLTRKAAPPLPEHARRAIREAAEYALPLRASELSQIVQLRSRSWQLARDGEELNIYLDLIPEDEYKEHEAAFPALEAALKEALEGMQE